MALTEPTFPGCVIPARPSALLQMYDGDTPDHEILAVPFADPPWTGLGSRIEGWARARGGARGDQRRTRALRREGAPS